MRKILCHDHESENDRVGQAFTETIKLMDVLVVADVLVAELRMDIEAL